MRWPVEVIIDMLGSGMTIEQIIKEHKELEREDILASLNFARLYLLFYLLPNLLIGKDGTNDGIGCFAAVGF